MSGNRRRRARNLLDNAEEQVRRFAGVLNNVLNRERQDLVSHPDREFSVSSESEEESDSIGSSSDNSEEYSEGSTDRVGDTDTGHQSRRLRSENIRGSISELRVRNPHPPSPASEQSDWSIPDESSSRRSEEDEEIEVITVNPVQRWNRVIIDESFDMSESQVADNHAPSHPDLLPVSPLQISENNNYNVENNRPISSDSDSSQLNIRRRPKRRRTDELATQDEEQACSSKPDPIKVSEPQNNKAVTVIENDADDDGCTICYEDFANAGVHRLVSLKCGHFFGQSCIERWIRGEGRSAGCPTCKAKASNKDIRKHYARSIKLTDTSELESLRELNATLHVKVSQLEMESAKKDREISDLNRRLKEGVNRAPVVPLSLPYSRPGRMSLTPGKKMALSISNNGSSRAFDWNGEYFAVGVSSPGSMFQPYAVRKVGWVSSEFRAGPCLPLHSNRIRVVSFSPFESNLVLSGGEDKKAVVHILGGSVRKQWKMPNDRQVWAGCWTAPNKVALGLNDGRVLEFDIELESTEPVRDFTQGIGNMPILFIGFDPTSSVLVVASFKKVLAFHNDRVFPLLNSLDDQFDKIRSIAFDEGTLSFVATFSPGTNSPGISHRLYKIEVNQDSDEICCVKLGVWVTACVQSSTMWNNCLFSYQNGLFSIIYNEDKKRLDVHDWSGKRTDVMMGFSSSSSSCNIASMRTIGGTKDCEKTVILLSELAIYSASFKILE